MFARGRRRDHPAAGDQDARCGGGVRVASLRAKRSKAIQNFFRRVAPHKNGCSYGPACATVSVAGAFFFRSSRQLAKRCTTTKKAGTNSTARQVEASMPEKA